MKTEDIFLIIALIAAIIFGGFMYWIAESQGLGTAPIREKHSVVGRL